MSRINWKDELPTIRELGHKGWNMNMVAQHYKVSRQRIKQVVDKFLPEWHTEMGFAAVRKMQAIKTQQKHGAKVDTDLYRAQKLKFTRKKYNAQRNGHDWSVNFGDFVFPDNCPILGITLDYFSETTCEASPSFDRIDSSKGYISGNVHIVSWRANRIKNDGSAEEHRKIAEYLDKISTTCIV